MHAEELSAPPTMGRVRSRRRRTRQGGFRHWVRTHRALAILFVVLLLLVALLIGWLIHLNRELGAIDRFQMDLDRDGRPARVAGGGVNVLLLGLDDNDYLDDVGPDMHELVEGGEWQAGAFRSDAIMVLHINDDGQQGQLVSIPRDSWVEIPGHGRNKINAALSLGGPELAARTVEDTFDLYVDHVMLVDFQGFRDLSDILDGVSVTVAETTTDTLSGKTWEAGPHRLRGNDALLFVRQRYGLARGDFDRVHRQQAFLRGVLDGAASRGTLLNPVRVTRLVDELSEVVAVDEHFTTARMRELALRSRGLRSHAMRFLTVPNLGTGTEGRASIVRLDLANAREMFAALEADRFEGWYAHNVVDELSPAGVN